MTKKMTISIPDELYEKLERWRESINFSGVFQLAISSEIEKKEGFRKRLKEDASMETTIARLKAERQESERQDFEDGKMGGLSWAKSAHYRDLKYVAENICSSNELEFWHYRNDEYIGDYVNDLFEDERTDPGRDWDSYFLGWKEAAEEFWEEIRDKLAD